MDVSFFREISFKDLFKFENEELTLFIVNFFGFCSKTDLSFVPTGET